VILKLVILELAILELLAGQVLPAVQVAILLPILRQSLMLLPHAY
jgi:hypothetical protein